MTYVYGVLIVVGIAAIFGFLLAIADFYFTIKEDERLEPLTALLPGINCGSCGYAGCKEMASGILKGEVKAVSQCRPSRPAARTAIVEFLATHPDESGATIEIGL